MNEQEIHEILSYLSYNQNLIGVSKTRSREEILAAHKYGINHFGENYVQELIKKYDESDDFSWHFIGRLQTNKIKDIVSRVVLIHSVYREKELTEINKQSKKINKITNILIEVNLIPNDLTHGGISVDNLDEFIKLALSYSNICVKGFMIIGPNTDEEEKIEEVFIKGKELFDKYKKIYHSITELSMGMSDDYKIALRHGSTFIRIGTKIFGKRNYDV